MGEIKVLYEDEDLVAISKPAGVVVHHDAQHQSGTVADWFLEYYPRGKDIGDPDRPGVVHRLDRDTSGALLLAKTVEAYSYLKKLFQEGKIKKTYLALVVGSPKNDNGVIDAPIARSTKHFERRVVGGKQGRAREAITEYKVLERFRLSGDRISGNDECTLLEVSPKTGRTHQIRSHLAFIGHPVACDRLYGGKRYACHERAEGQPLARQFLHASMLEFTLPSGSHLRIEDELPADLEGALAELREKK